MSSPTHRTPWDPSEKAIRRVNHPLPVPTMCSYCLGAVVAVDNDQDYHGRVFGSWSWIYACTQCRAYAEIHPYTDIPVGILSDQATRQARARAKIPFQKLFQTRLVRRKQAYTLLAMKMGIPKAQCHFGWFDVTLCRRAEQASLALLKQYRSAGRGAAGEG